MNAQPYHLPPALRDIGKLLEDAGISIVYGPNPTPVPEVLSVEAKRAWLNLPQIPLPANDPKQLDAMRRFTAALDQAAYEELKEPYSIHDLAINGITTMWITPPELTYDDKAMVFIHGGAYIVNSRRSQLPLQTSVASKLGVRVTSIGYPLAPEHPYPAATDAIVEAYKGLLDQYDAANLGLFGTSAGGGLVLATLMRLRQDSLPLPAATAALSPGADLTLSGDLFTLCGARDPILPVQGAIDSFAGYYGTADPSDPLVSPIFGDFTDVTPIFLLAGTREMIGSDAIRTAAAARKDGCDVTLIVNDGMWHMGIADGSGIPEQQFAFDQMIDFLRTHLLRGEAAGVGLAR